MTKFYIHLGLHKTGTKFFQHKVFPNLDKTKFLYNPPRLTQLACDLMKAFPEDADLVIREIIKEKKQFVVGIVSVPLSPNKKYFKVCGDSYIASSHLSWMKSHKIIISREILSGDLFSFYKNSQETIGRLHKAFNDAYIIYSKRFQVDWIVSCYRESIHEHHYQSIENFLSLKKINKEFVYNKFQDLDIHKYEAHLKELFNPEQLHLLYYEDFKENKLNEVDKIAKIIGSSEISVKNDNDGRPNRGYSAFSIKLSIFRFKFYKFFGLSRLFVHRPIFFFGNKGIPAGFENLSVLSKEKY